MTRACVCACVPLFSDAASSSGAEDGDLSVAALGPLDDADGFAVRVREGEDPAGVGEDDGPSRNDVAEVREAERFPGGQRTRQRKGAAARGLVVEGPSLQVEVVGSVVGDADPFPAGLAPPGGVDEGGGNEHGGGPVGGVDGGPDRRRGWRLVDGRVLDRGGSVEDDRSVDGIRRSEYLGKDQARVVLDPFRGDLVHRDVVSRVALLVPQRFVVLQVDEGPGRQLIVLVDEADDLEKAGRDLGRGISDKPVGDLGAPVDGPRKDGDLVAPVFLQVGDPVLDGLPLVLIQVLVLEAGVRVVHGVVGGRLGLRIREAPCRRRPPGHVATVPLVVGVVAVVQLVIGADFGIDSPAGADRRPEEHLIDVQSHADRLPAGLVGRDAVVDVLPPRPGGGVEGVARWVPQDVVVEVVLLAERRERDVHPDETGVVAVRSRAGREDRDREDGAERGSGLLLSSEHRHVRKVVFFSVIW
mmetsp:Transcript_17115/g.39509  ORF Transcript_17115/g.39509 Transcript_17115/m.39509 type:complete len:470 (-) Transcript_17115:26-1435(-)